MFYTYNMFHGTRHARLFFVAGVSLCRLTLLGVSGVLCVIRREHKATWQSLSNSAGSQIPEKIITMAKLK